MKIIAICSQKGGSGKTTLSGHLAVAAEKAGMGSVAMIDTDPQGSLSDWWNERESEQPLFVNSSVAYISEDIQKLRTLGVNLLVVDTPPAITTSIQAIINIADLVVIPTRPSPHDLRAAGATVDMADRSEKPLVFVINAATPRARLTTEAAIALSQHGAVAPTVVHNRQDFAASMIDGRTVLEMENQSRSALEITELWQFIDQRLKSISAKSVFRGPVHRTGHRGLFGNKKTRPVSENPGSSIPAQPINVAEGIY